MDSQYLPIVVLLLGAIGFALAPLGLAWVWARAFSPQKSGPSKNAIYECGLEASGDSWVQFKPGYYLYAIVFLVFDVEAVFLLPVAVAFHGSVWARRLPCWCFCCCWWRGWCGPSEERAGVDLEFRAELSGQFRDGAANEIGVQCDVQRNPRLDEGLKSELSRQGIFATTLQDLYNWGGRVPSGR